MIDAYLELRNGDKPAIEGETLDKILGAKHRRGVQLISFELSSQVDLTPREKTTSSEMFGNLFDEPRDDEPEDEEEQEYFTFTVTKEIDNATPEFFTAYCQHWSSTKTPSTAAKTEGIFDEAKVTIRKAAGSKPIEYLVFEFREVWIKSWELSNKDGDDLPEEELEFCFNACQMRYWPQKVDGSRGVMIPSNFWYFRALDENQ